MWFLFTHKKKAPWINFFLIFITSFGLIDSVSGKLILKKIKPKTQRNVVNIYESECKCRGSTAAEEEKISFDEVVGGSDAFQEEISTVFPRK